MRTKTLLLTAAISAAGILASMAAGVTSVNVVGYININVPKGFSFLADQLKSSDDTVKSVLSAPPVGTVIYGWNGGFSANGYGTFFPDTGDPADLVWDNPDQHLALGSGVLVFAPSAFTVTFVGEVAQGNLSTTLSKGFNFASSQVPQAGGMQSVLGYAPHVGDVVYTWSAGFSANGFGTFFPDTNDPADLVWDSGEPVLAVGDAVLLFSKDGQSWDRNFVVP